MYQITVWLKPICDTSIIRMLADNDFRIYRVNPVTSTHSSHFQDEECDTLPSHYHCIYNGGAPANLQIILAVLNNNPSVSEIQIKITE